MKTAQWSKSFSCTARNHRFLQLWRCDAYERSYNGDPLHVRQIAKIGGVLRDPSYLGLWWEFEDGSMVKIILLYCCQNKGGYRVIIRISGCGGSLKTAQGSKSFSCAARNHRFFSFGAPMCTNGVTYQKQLSFFSSSFFFFIFLLFLLLLFLPPLFPPLFSPSFL